MQIPSDITDERMLLSVSSTQTTLYDQIRYAGSPSSFAWVLPIHGEVTVGLSADVLFDSIDALTATQIEPPPSSCPAPPNCSGGGCGSSSDESLDAGSALPEGPPPVVVTKQANVGPYATVQLHATDPSALDDWLTQNGFVIPSEVTPILDEYVGEGFDFLAMKLRPDQGVQAMRPVRVSSPGASFTLPLRMAAIGTGVTVGITIWVVSSSIDLSEQLITNAILSGGQNSIEGGGFGGPPAPSDPSEDYLPVGPEVGASGVEGGPDDARADEGGAEASAGAEAPDGAATAPTQTAEEVRAADMNALFAGLAGPNVRVTRIRGDIAHAAMTADLVLQASADQSELSNVRVVVQSVNEQCPIYDGCAVVGTGSPAQSAASEHHGCTASTQAFADPTGGAGAVAGMLGLFLARLLRRRRGASRGA